jgi:hypothetical protein
MGRCGMESWECQAGVTQGTVNKALHKIFCHGRHLKEDLLVKTLKREIFKATIGSLQGRFFFMLPLLISENFLLCFHFSAQCLSLPQ